MPGEENRLLLLTRTAVSCMYLVRIAVLYLTRTAVAVPGKDCRWLYQMGVVAVPGEDCRWLYFMRTEDGST